MKAGDAFKRLYEHGNKFSEHAQTATWRGSINKCERLSPRIALSIKVESKIYQFLINLAFSLAKLPS